MTIHGVNEHGELVFTVGERTSQITRPVLRDARKRLARMGGALEVNRVRLDESDLAALDAAFGVAA